MHRVSSRQRLVSWDAFDATITNNAYDPVSSDEIFFSTYDNNNDEESETLPLKRKRNDRSNKIHPLLTDGADVFGPVNDVNVVEDIDRDDIIAHSLPELPKEILLAVFQFSNVADLRSVMSVNKSFSNLLRSQEAIESIWKPQIVQRWPFVKSHQADLVDTLNIGYNKLLKCSVDTPEEIDESLFPVHGPTTRVTRSAANRSSKPAELVVTPEHFVHFTGTVGIGDRCIRSSVALPHPSIKKQKLPNLLQRFAIPRICGPFHTISTSPRPFVAPFLTREGLVDLTPRLISYFEVSILPIEAAPLDERHPHTVTMMQPFRVQRAPECVAVGVCTRRFGLQGRMPGWDAESYGYHGDDGGIFHDTGTMVQEFGHRFGVGDTVGCGVDYGMNAIFYTRNGQFSGYAFVLEPQHVEEELFPVVGLDTNCPVSCNFGTTKPFVFDLKKMLQAERQRNIVLSAM
jgi:hypothetical protein